MKFKVKTKDIADAIDRLSLIPQKAAIAAYSYIRLLNKNNELHIQACNGAIYGEVRISSEGEDADLLIDKRVITLIGIVKSAEIEIDITPTNGIAKIASGDGVYEFAFDAKGGKAFNDFAKQCVTSKLLFTSQSEPLTYAVYAAAITSYDSNALNSVLDNIQFIISSDNKLTINGATKYVLMRGVVNGDTASEHTFLLNNTIVKPMLKAIANTDDVAISAVVGSGIICFTANNITLYVTATQERYVNTDRVIAKVDKSAYHKADVSLKAIKSAAIRMGDEAHFRFQVDAAHDTAIITRNAAITEIAAKCDVDIDILISVGIIDKLMKIAPNINTLYIKDGQSLFFAENENISIYAQPVSEK